MKHLLSVLLSVLIAHSALFSQENSNKIQYKFGGNIDLRAAYNSRNSYIPSDVINCYTYAPAMNTQMVDLNGTGNLSLTPFASRLSFKVSNFDILGAKVNTFTEVDFLGNSGNYVQMLRLRHAYMNFKWEKDRLLIGQTSTILSVEDVLLANTVDFGAGTPFNALNRGFQVRYDRIFSKNIRLSVAAQMYGVHTTVGPTNAQKNAGIPDMQLQMVFGDNSKKGLVAGFTVGAKFLRPRTVDFSDNITTMVVPSYLASGFFKFYLGDYKFQALATYGENLSPYYFLGGYGKVSTTVADMQTDPNGDYEYANINSLSSWFDFETPKYGPWALGLFIGYQANFGSNTDLDLTTDSNGNFLYSYVEGSGLQWFARVSPRVWFTASKNLSFGLEYSFNPAQWSETINLKTLPYIYSDGGNANYSIVSNNRVIALAKFVF